MLSQTGHPASLELAAAQNLAVVRAARDCAAAIAAYTPPVARRSMIRQILAEQLGWDMTRPGWPADMLGFLLREVPVPFTLMAARLTGETPRVEPDGPTEGAERRCTGAEAQALAVLDTGALWLWERAGTMILGRTVAGQVRLRLAPARIPGGWDGDELARIRKGEPCGQVIPGLVRALRAGRVHWPAAPAVDGGALLQRATGTPFGFADEQIGPALIERLAGPAA